MTDKSNSGQESPDKKKFIRESVGKDSAGVKRQRLIRVIKFVVAAVIFGLIATCTAVVSGPWIQKMLGREETEATHTQYTIPRDDPAASTAQAETQPSVEETASEETSSAEDTTANIQEEVESALSTYQYVAGDVAALNKAVSQMAAQADSAIVTVHSVKNNTDWFENPIENTGMYTGVVINKTEDEIVVLVPEAAVESVDSIKVMLHGDGEYDATLRRTDKLSGLAVVAVSADQMDSTAMDKITAISLGNSYVVSRGDMVVAVGSPLGMAYSYNYGTISYATGGLEAVDGSESLFYTDMEATGTYGTWVLNKDGELIGWISNVKEDTTSITAITGVSEYKSLLERMSNGQASPYLGVLVADVRAAGDSDMPAGMYVKTVEAASPAYQTGLQPGDIIVGIGSTDIISMRGFQNELDKLHADDAITLKVMRGGMDGYKEIDYQVVVGSR